MDNKEAIEVLKSNYPNGKVMLSEAVDLSIKALENSTNILVECGTLPASPNSAMGAIALALKEHITLAHGTLISKEAFAALDAVIGQQHQ